MYTPSEKKRLRIYIAMHGEHCNMQCDVGNNFVLQISFGFFILKLCV